MNTLKNFLEVEISYQDMYEEIVYFINSHDIRCGELECNEYILKKMDRDNFFVFKEDIYPDGVRDISDVVCLDKDLLLNMIQDYAKKTGLSVIA